MIGFTKLDKKIITSSVMAEPSDTFKVWVAFLASCDYDGIARVTSVFLSSICHLELPIVDKAVARLEAPDPRSRSKEHDGRRIIPVPEGWFVVNYKKYRAFTYSDSPEAIRQRRHREKERDNPLHVTDGRDVSISISNSELDNFFNQFWDAYDYKIKKSDAHKAFMKLMKEGVTIKELAQAVHGYIDYLKSKKVDEGFDQAKMYPATFLRGDRWRDYVGYKYEPPL